MKKTLSKISSGGMESKRDCIWWRSRISIRFNLNVNGITMWLVGYLRSCSARD